MDVHQPVEVGLAGLGERRIDADAGVVDQKVEIGAAPIVGQRPFEVGGEGGETRDVAGVERGT